MKSAETGKHVSMHVKPIESLCCPRQPRNNAVYRSWWNKNLLKYQFWWTFKELVALMKGVWKRDAYVIFRDLAFGIGRRQRSCTCRWNTTRRKSTLNRDSVSPPSESNWRFVEVFLQAYLKHKLCSVKEICDTCRILAGYFPIFFIF